MSAVSSTGRSLRCPVSESTSCPSGIPTTSRSSSPHRWPKGGRGRPRPYALRPPRAPPVRLLGLGLLDAGLEGCEQVLDRGRRRLRRRLSDLHCLRRALADHLQDALAVLV